MQMSNFALYVAAIVCFLIAAFPHGWKIRTEYLAFAFLVATLL